MYSQTLFDKKKNDQYKKQVKTEIDLSEQDESIASHTVSDAVQYARKPSLVDQTELSDQEKTKLVDEAAKEVSKEEIKKDISQEQKLEELKEQSHHVLFKMSTVFPFDFFPDDIIIDIHKITIVSRSFFASGSVNTIPIEAVGDAHVSHSIFFAELNIVSTTFKGTLLKISYLQKKDALKAKRIISGLAVIAKKKIDLTKIHEKDLLASIEEIGEVQGKET